MGDFTPIDPASLPGQSWKEYAETLRFYLEHVKPAIVEAEDVDQQSRLSATAINEIRAAFDHLARSHASLFGIIEGNSAYIESQIRDARDHLYRAGCDAFDETQLSHRAALQEMLNKIEPEALYMVAPEQGRDAMRTLTEAAKLSTAARLDRDVVDKRPLAELFREYKEPSARLAIARANLEAIFPEVVRYMSDLRKKKRGQMWREGFAWFLAVIGIGVSLYFGLKSQSAPVIPSNLPESGTPIRPTGGGASRPRPGQGSAASPASSSPPHTHR